jgi:glycolate oxidase iron-sulfur subunit
MIWVTEWAPLQEELDSCVSCGLCLPYCPTYRLTGDESASPRGRLAAMSAVHSGRIEMDGRFEEVMGFCLQCRACEAVCPSLVPFGRAMEGARAELTAQRPSTVRIGRRLLVGRAVRIRWLVRAGSVLLAMAQRLRLGGLLPGLHRLVGGLRPIALPIPSTIGGSWAPEGEPVGTAALLAGCVMDPWFGDVHRAVVAVLRSAGYRVEVPANQTCCGALAAHEGAAYDAAAMAARNVAAFTGYDLVVVDSAGCGAHLKDYRHWADEGGPLADRVVDATEVVARLVDHGLLPDMADANRGEVAVQDPCHLRHAQRVVEEPRRVLRAAGYVPVEIDPAGMCCGAAGAYALSHPETSQELGRQKAAQVVASGAPLVASANPGCDMQLRSQLGGSVRIAHPVELYAEALGV